MRLQKFLALAGLASRRRAEDMIKSGAVTVNGAVVSTFGVQVDPERDNVEVEGKRVKAEALLYRLLLKPRACLSILTKPTGDQVGRPTLAKFVTDTDIPWHVVAPLDFPSEGVVLLTTDGELAERMSRDGGKVPMTYHIKFQGKVGDDEIGKLLRGWKWEKRPVRAKSAVPIATTGKNTWVEVVLPEARPRVLKGAGDALRRPVLKISRVRMGPLSFEGLEMGAYRDLTKSEAASLRRAAGLEGKLPGHAEGKSDGQTQGKPHQNKDTRNDARTARTLAAHLERKGSRDDRPRQRGTVRTPSRGYDHGGQHKAAGDQGGRDKAAGDQGGRDKAARDQRGRDVSRERPARPAGGGPRRGVRPGRRPPKKGAPRS